MTSSTSSSSRRVARVAALLATALLATAIGGAGCAHRSVATPLKALGLEDGERLRVLVLPVENLTGGPARLEEVQAEVRSALASRFEVVPPEELEPFLSRH